MTSRYFTFNNAGMHFQNDVDFVEVVADGRYFAHHDDGRIVDNVGVIGRTPALEQALNFVEENLWIELEMTSCRYFTHVNGFKSNPAGKTKFIEYRSDGRRFSHYEEPLGDGTHITEFSGDGRKKGEHELKYVSHTLTDIENRIKEGAWKELDPFEINMPTAVHPTAKPSEVKVVDKLMDKPMTDVEMVW